MKSLSRNWQVFFILLCYINNYICFMFKANFIGQAGLYKNQEYVICIGVINGWIHVRRKCGAGRMNYPSILDFLRDWDNIRKV